MKKTLFILILILVVQVLLRMPFLQEPLERDEGLYGYMGQRILAGEIPYRDVFDHKTPVIYYIYALVIKLFGGSILSIRIFTLFYSLLTTLSIYYLARLLWGEGEGMVAALLFAVFSGGPVIQGSNANCEVFMILPLIFALYLFILGRRIMTNKEPATKRRGSLIIWGAGLLSGLAVMIKQVAVFNLLALLGFAIFGGWAGVLWLLLGALTFPLAFIAYFMAQGAISDFVNCIFFANVTYIKTPPPGPFWMYIQDCANIIFSILLYDNAILWVLASVGIVYILYKDRKNENALIVVWGGLSLFGVVAGKRFFGHYFIQVLPALALLSAYTIFSIRNKVRIALVAVCVLLLIPVLWEQWSYYVAYSPSKIQEKKFGNVFWEKAFEVAEDVKGMIGPADEIFVWDSHPEIYYYLGKKSPSYYAYYLNWMGEEPKQQIFKEVFRRPPKYILWTSYSNYDKPLVDFIKKNYKLRDSYPVYKGFNWGLFERTRPL